MTIIKKFEVEEKQMLGFFGRKLSRKIWVVSGAILLLLVIAEVWATNTIAKYGNKLESSSNLQESLKTENQILENQISRLSSLNNISSKSAELGFSETESIQYIR